jgi:hypothetical protein
VVSAPDRPNAPAAVIGSRWRTDAILPDSPKNRSVPNPSRLKLCRERLGTASEDRFVWRRVHLHPGLLRLRILQLIDVTVVTGFSEVTHVRDRDLAEPDTVSKLSWNGATATTTAVTTATTLWPLAITIFCIVAGHHQFCFIARSSVAFRAGEN